MSAQTRTSTAGGGASRKWGLGGGTLRRETYGCQRQRAGISSRDAGVSPRPAHAGAAGCRAPEEEGAGGEQVTHVRQRFESGRPRPVPHQAGEEASDAAVVVEHVGGVP